MNFDYTYPPFIINYGTREFEFVPLDKGNDNKPTAKSQENIDLLNWWFTWKNDVPENVMINIHAWCPALQTDGSLKQFGVTTNMISVLKRLKPKISKINKKELLTREGIEMHFSECVNQAIEDIGFVTSEAVSDPNTLGVYAWVV